MKYSGHLQLTGKKIDGLFEGVIAFRKLKFSVDLRDLNCFDDYVKKKEWKEKK